jgi:ferrous iron transport protein A
VVVAVEAPEPVAERLRELGFLPGTEVALVRRAPLGDPSVYELRGTRLCLRRTEAAAVRVRTQPGTLDAA